MPPEAAEAVAKAHAGKPPGADTLIAPPQTTSGY
jgi:hypothetical protein